MFNIGENKYRLITTINYKIGSIKIDFILTHEEQKEYERQQKEVALQQLEDERQQKQLALQQLEALTARLRELGINPDEVP